MSPQKMTIEYLENEPVKVRVDGEFKKLSPQQRALVAALAESDDAFQTCETLLAKLDVDCQRLYRLVYDVRRRLGSSELIAQVGSRFSRGGRTFGCSGYRLTCSVFRTRPGPQTRSC